MINLSQELCNQTQLDDRALTVKESWKEKGRLCRLSDWVEFVWNLVEWMIKHGHGPKVMLFMQ